MVVIEYNAVLPPGRRLVQPRGHPGTWDGTDYFGASLDARSSLADRKGYTLVHTDLAAINAFSVRSELAADAAAPPGRGGASAPTELLHAGPIATRPIRGTNPTRTWRRTSPATLRAVVSAASTL